MNYTVLTYALYIPFTLFLTVWVGRTLFNNGKRFLLDIFHGDTHLSDSINKLLLVGFYLINFGYALLSLKITSRIANVQDVFEQLSFQMGTIVIVLGAIHFLNLIGLYTYRKRAKHEQVLSKN